MLNHDQPHSLITQDIPRPNARYGLDRAQISLLIMALVLTIIGLNEANFRYAPAIFSRVWDWFQIALALVFIVFLLGQTLSKTFSLIWFWLIYKAPSQGEMPPQANQLPTNQSVNWPRYSILLAHYHESNMISSLVKSIQEIDYPSDKLDVLFLLEDDDFETISAVNAHIGLLNGKIIFPAKPIPAQNQERSMPNSMPPPVII